MTTTQEIIDKTNAKIAEAQERTGAIGSEFQTGTDEGDVLFGSTFSDSSLDGLGEDDRIFGRFGNDVLNGGDGDDLIDGGNGDDTLEGGGGEDNMFGKLGNDFLGGGADNDIMDGGLGDDQLDGGDGDDQLTGGPDNDVLLGGNGLDSLTGAGGNQTEGNPQQDILIGSLLDAQGNPVPDSSSDLFVLGNDNGSFYTSAGDEDFALILGFEAGVDQLQLSPVGDFSLSTAAAFSPVDTIIFDGGDRVAIVVGVDLTV